MKIVMRIMVGRHIKERVCNIDSNATLRDLANISLESTRDAVGSSEVLPTFKLTLPPSTLIKDAGIGNGSKVFVNSVMTSAGRILQLSSPASGPL